MIEQVEIIAVGTELLLGVTENTNASWLARQLSLLGLSSRYQVVIGDNHARLQAQLEQSLTRSDCVILTGGLGPTADDITMQVAAEVAGLELEFHEESWQRIVAYFAETGRVPSDNNHSQVYLPNNQRILPNANGTAPGVIMEFLFQGRKSYLILLPGPPLENRPMFLNHVQPFLEEHSEWRMEHRYLRLIGIGESDAEARILDLIEAQEETTIAPYAHAGEMLFRLTRRYARSEDPEQALAYYEEAQANLDRVEQSIRERLGRFIYHVGESTLPELVCGQMLAQGVSFAFVESLTAGMAAAEAARYAGISAVFRGGLVSYQDAIKTQLLDVDPQVLQENGSVSEAVAYQMAEQGRQLFGSDYAISTTGIAGPTTPQSGQSVGLTYIAVAGPQGTRVARFKFSGNRQKIREVATLNAYNELRRSLIQDGVLALEA